MNSESHEGLYRLRAVEQWLAAVQRLIEVREIEWKEGWADLRLLAANYTIRHQLEALGASVSLAHDDLGHLAVGFVRPALDELLWILWLNTLTQGDAQEILFASGRSDGLRSLAAQRAYVGEEVMKELWYSSEFLDEQVGQHEVMRSRPKALQGKLQWAGGANPSAAWIAQQSQHGTLYDYLHSATSRALHFSMGEILRNSWGDPSGSVTTRHAKFREYRTAFALDQLPRLFLQTWAAVAELGNATGVAVSDDSEVVTQFTAAVKALGDLGRVPLVHAHEWNLTPDGPRPSPEQK